MTTRSTNRGLILLVDDTPTNLEMLVDCLSDHGFEVAVAIDGEAALKQSQLVCPDLILLDVMMPGLDGFEACRRLKENELTKDIPVIFITALADQDHILKGFSVGAVDYVIQPICQQELLARVMTHIQIRGLQRKVEETVVMLQQEVAERQRAEEEARKAMRLAQQANECMRKDLEAAARVQRALLPKTFPTVPGATFGWVYQPCAELGGDSLNVFKLDDRHVGLYVLDVSGHGVQASLLSVTLSRVLTPRGDPSCLFSREHLLAGGGALASPAEVATRLNHMFPMGPESHQYFTLIYGILDSQERTFQYVCAGHPPPILSDEDHLPIVCEARNVPIGLFEDEQYENSTITLGPGARIYLYSDGVLEAMNNKREIFDEPRLRSAIETTRQGGMEESVNSILRSIYTWSGSKQIHDDLSILGVELK